MTTKTSVGSAPTKGCERSGEAYGVSRIQKKTEDRMVAGKIRRLGEHCRSKDGWREDRDHIRLGHQTAVAEVVKA